MLEYKSEILSRCTYITAKITLMTHPTLLPVKPMMNSTRRGSWESRAATGPGSSISSGIAHDSSNAHTMAVLLSMLQRLSIASRGPNNRAEIASFAVPSSFR